MKDKQVLVLPQEINLLCAQWDIDKNNNNINFLMFVSSILDAGLFLHVTDGGGNLTIRVMNTIEHCKLINKTTNEIFTLPPTEEVHNLIEGAAMEFASGLAAVYSNVSYEEYSYVIENILNDRIIIILRKK